MKLTLHQICLSFPHHGNCVMQISLSDQELWTLQRDLQVSRQAAFAPGTLKNLKCQWKSFLVFCMYFGLQYLPTSLSTVSLYAQYLQNYFKSVDSVRNYIHGVKILHFYVGCDFPWMQTFEFRSMLKGFARLKPHRRRRAAAITPGILMKLHDVMDLEDPVYMAAWSAFLIAFFSDGQKIKCCPTQLGLPKFSSVKHLTRCNISITDSGLLVSLFWSKTNQFGSRVLQVPLPTIPNSLLCPTSAFERLVAKVPGSPDLPAFAYVVRPKLLILTKYKFVKSLEHFLELAGLNPMSFKGHSCRRGGASFAFQAGVPGELIKLHGDWASSAYLSYLDFSLDSRWAVGCKMRDLILQLPTF